MRAPLLLAPLAALLPLLPATASQDGPVAVGLTPESAKTDLRTTLSVPLSFPGRADVFFHPATADWPDTDCVSGVAVLPDDAPANLQALAFLKDRDSRWYQVLYEGRMGPGTNRWEVDLRPSATGWGPQGHHGVWHHRLRLSPDAVGIRLFSDGASYTGACTIASVSASVCTNRFAAPPEFLAVDVPKETVACQGLFEVEVSISDRHNDPFDYDKAWLRCEMTTPSGTTHSLDGFYYEPYYRTFDDMGGELVPNGRPHWRVRFCPREPGEHRYRLFFRDRGGEAEWGPATFLATPAPDGAPRFVRVSTNDFRQFEFDDGTYYYPIGHNIRSPFDTRMDEQFPWRFRHPEGSEAYRRYLRDMRAAGENLVEIWMCAWSLGIEWSNVINGYHGAGDYHLGNAWELDEVLGWAYESAIYVNLVLNNHGRASEWCDPEWGDHPYNKTKGGFLDRAMEFFDNPRAIALQKQSMRYVVARWGWCPSIFAWELWSEGNLCGNEGNQRTNFDPRYLAWHQTMGDHLHAIDPNRHLVATHTSGDFNAQNPAIAVLPQIDFCAVDAYHNSPDPLHIVHLVRATAQFNNKFQKPVLITEFGGSPMAAGENHLRRELHAALWASTCAPLAGSPLFWWWQLVEEADFYPMYAAIARFMADVDRRDPALAPVDLNLRIEETKPLPGNVAGHIAMASPDLSLGWIFVRSSFQVNAPPLEKPLEEVTMTLPNLPDGIYRVEFWDTAEGKVLQRQDQRSQDNRLVVDVPPFSRDIAFKVRPLRKDY
ncbi:MAG: DUF5060 domain-containing protein [Kiritimatiellia bacterium]|jgi:hypothetical protein